MNEIVNKFLLEGDKFMLEMQLRQVGFSYSACGPFTKNKERTKKFKEKGDSWYIYQNKLFKACFEHGIGYGDFKVKYYMINHLILLKIKNMMNTKEVLLQWLTIFFDKETAGPGAVQNKNMPDQQLPEEFHKPIIRKF